MSQKAGKDISRRIILFVPKLLFVTIICPKPYRINKTNYCVPRKFSVGRCFLVPEYLVGYKNVGQIMFSLSMIIFSKIIFY